jgi:hypothetical protein
VRTPKANAEKFEKAIGPYEPPTKVGTFRGPFSDQGWKTDSSRFIAHHPRSNESRLRKRATALGVEVLSTEALPTRARGSVFSDGAHGPSSLGESGDKHVVEGFQVLAVDLAAWLHVCQVDDHCSRFRQHDGELPAEPKSVVSSGLGLPDDPSE